MSKDYKFTWQAIGISSNPSIKRDPVSLHMLAYLKYASECSDEHLVVIGDTMQVVNYIVLHGLNPKQARRTASKKGKRKQKDLEKICSAYGLENVSFLRFDDLSEGILPMKTAIEELYENNPVVREAILDTIPKRLKQGLCDEDIERLSAYTIDELAFSLHLGAVRISHTKQKKVDALVQSVHDEYGIGRSVEYDYTGLGLDFDTRTKREFEPYSAARVDGRLLLTDDVAGLEAKAEVMPEKRARKVNNKLRRIWGNDLADVNEFYRKIVRKGELALNWPKHVLRGTIGATALASVLACVIGWSAIMTDRADEIVRNPEVRDNYIQAVERVEFGPQDYSGKYVP